MIQCFTCMIFVTGIHHSVSSLTGPALAAGRPFYFKLNLLIFSGGAAVKFRITEPQYFYCFVSSFAFRHQTKHNLTSRDGCWRDAGARRSVWLARSSVGAVHTAKIFQENLK